MQCVCSISAIFCMPIFIDTLFDAFKMADISICQCICNLWNWTFNKDTIDLFSCLPGEKLTYYHRCISLRRPSIYHLRRLEKNDEFSPEFIHNFAFKHTFSRNVYCRNVRIFISILRLLMPLNIKFYYKALTQT